MKLLILVAIALLFAGCAPKPGQEKAPPAKKDGMDSPITVSDGSTHLHHGSFVIKNEKNDDDARNVIHVHISDANFTGFWVSCASGCAAANSTALPTQWALQLWDGPNGTGTNIATMRSPDDADIKIHYFGRKIHPEVDPAGSVDIVQDNDLFSKFKSAKFYSGTTSVTGMATQTFSCTSSPCTVRIDYCPTGTPAANCNPK